MALKMKAWAVIRHSPENGEWIAYDEISSLAEMAERRARKTDSEIPMWAKEHKILRLALVEITEIKAGAE